MRALLDGGGADRAKGKLQGERNVDAAAPNSRKKVKSRNFDAVASFYERLAALYSFGMIRRSKRVELKYLEPGQRVLFLGVGSGEDAVMAARKGCEVTAIDLSERMIEGLRRRLAHQQLTAELIAGDALEQRPEQPYDAVCGNFFFNIFSTGDMPVVLAHAAGLVKRGGRLMIADMAPPEGVGGALAWPYLKLGQVAFWMVGLTANHPVYDYQACGRAAGLDVEKVHDFGMSWGPPLFRTVILRQNAVPERTAGS